MGGKPRRSVLSFRDDGTDGQVAFWNPQERRTESEGEISERERNERERDKKERE
jgi:hypothetical protein